MLKSNETNSISKDALRDEGCLWLINCTTQEYLVNVEQDSHFDMPLMCGGPTKHMFGWLDSHLNCEYNIFFD